ncbi:hypothetical protein GCM10028803_05280 [Larkinella knui]|uniref:DUF5977 domain-containing protein n=1 Tax=Larkinella knui TaxID=2025310 RepID=A0A3P1CLK1_9BACT|nr:DUF5977 domain-containing protein [Larkinella knui]RRB13794.1 hypothetical protein EHT87_16175 [Larkinella knui]
MIDYLATQTYLPARLSMNPIVVNIEAADPDLYPLRGDLRYFCTVMIPEFYLAGTFKQLVRLEAAEQPPVSAGSGLLYQGAFFEIQNQLDPLLERTAPEFNQARISVADRLTMPYYCILSIENDGEEIFSETQPVQYIVKAGISEVDYAQFKEQFFTEFIGPQRRFLTWAANPKIIQADQPEFLYFLTNFTPSPTRIRTVFQAYYSDLTSDEGVSDELENVFPYTVYCVPVGPKALGLDLKPKPLTSYRVWLVNENDERISEKREFRMDQQYRRNIRFLVFGNSLGGFDTLCLTGQGQEGLKLNRSISDRYAGWEFLPSYSERVINAVTGIRELSVATGWLSAEGLRYLEELQLSKEVYLVADRAMIPLVPGDEKLVPKIDDEELIGRTLVFEFGNASRNYSQLPAISALSQRPTGWRPKATACLVDGDGKRTGLMQVSVLEKYYLDDHKKVVGVPLKANVPGTEGYLSPVESASCLASPFENGLIEQVGTYLRQTCPAGQFGGPATITIPAGAYGSEVSQADADAKAADAWARLNTQAYADANGSCISGPENYTWAVPVGCFHYRSNSPVNFYIYYDQDPKAGNLWGMTPGPNVYPMNTNDLDLPLQTPGIWKFLLKHPLGGGYGAVNVYVNGVLRNTYPLIPYNASGGKKLFFTDGLDGVSGDKVYLEFTHGAFV